MLLTGELLDIERVPSSSERGRWKSTCEGNSLAAYSISRPVLKTNTGSDFRVEFNRYLYRLPAQWVDYDPKRKEFTAKPGLPSWAIPGRNSSAQDKGSHNRAHTLPADGTELLRRLTGYDARLAEQGLCMRGQKWPEQAILMAVEETKAFEQAARTKVRA